MQKYCFAALLMCLIVSCGGLPKIVPLQRSDSESIRFQCGKIFPVGRYQFVHRIQAQIPGGKPAPLLGVTDIAPQSRTIDCVMMTLEGFVLFNASYHQTLEVHRSVPPFDSKAFANGLIQDIQLIFFKPRGALLSCGHLSDGSVICRYQDLHGGVIDVICNEAADTWEIKKYNTHAKMIRWVTFTLSPPTKADDTPLIPREIELKALDYPGYTLDLQLVEARLPKQ